MNDYKVKKEYSEIVKSFESLTKFIVLKFESKELKIKDRIIRNFITKSYSLLNSIHILISHNQEREAIALYRMLIERYFYLEYLGETNDYQEFSDWSFIKAFESRNKMRSSSEYNNLETKKVLKDTKEQIKQYQELKLKNRKWKEPNLEQFAKEINLSHIYNFGYDFGSSYIHPRAEEGYLDALRILKNERIETFKLESVLINAISLANGILMLGTHNSELEWGKYLTFYYSAIDKFLKNEIELPNLKRLEKIIMASLLDK